MSRPVDVMAILADLQQQLTDLIDVVDAQQATLRDLDIVVRSQDHARRQRPAATALPFAVPPSPSSPSAPSSASASASSSSREPGGA